MAKKTFYITTAIDYVNAEPHIGHAFEKTIADALARFHRLHGEKVFFLTGTDENAPKNAQAAKEANKPIKEFVDANSKIFISLCKKLNISYDRFIRTTEEEHIKKAQELFQIAYDNGDIYKGKYEGYYCTGCEEYKTEKDLVNGKCPEHDEVKWISEETYFFKLSKYEEQVREFIRTYIVPKKRRNEILSRLKNEDLKDLSVTREKIMDWGINSPIDDNHKIYVWFDALINYISGSNKNWPATVHVIGKGINWFHSVIWPAMLFSTKQKLPKTLLVHGYLNLKGEKISKSKGNIINPIQLIEKYGSDPVRYSLLRCSIFDDSDYSEEILIQRNNSELANKLGNLISRVSTLAEKYGLEESKITTLDSKETIRKVKIHFEKFELDKALNEIFAFIDKCNEFIQNKKPWETKDNENSKNSRVPDFHETSNKKVLYELANAIKDFTILLSPFIPETCEKISKTFNFKLQWKDLEKPLRIGKIKKSEILFRKTEDQNS